MSRYDDDDDDLDIRRGSNYGPRPHSGLGMVSLAIAVFVVLAILFLIGIIFAVTINKNGQINDNDPEAIVLGLGIIGCGVLSLVGLALGIAGVSQPDRNPSVPVAGIILNALIILGGILLICLSALG